ncbi:hypothetical protein MTBUT4_260049 [Magnetospirillum sp. UT-4]|nr:hypothetical protein MTBUT4_260049 [Magnetospirillum sp. UT-4]
MAFPFGDHPTFATYIVWAQTQGCKVKSKLVATPDGPESVTLIISPDGKRWVTEAMDQREHMNATTIWRLDRRLGLNSPYFSVPPEGSEEK